MTENISISATPLVLIADDMPWIINDWAQRLASYGIDVVTASSLEDLNYAYYEHGYKLAAIILDGCIPGDYVNTIDFIRDVRKDGFTKPIVASSSLPEYRHMMVRMGCSHQATKHDAPDLVADLLSTP